jgi:hypothetical protein
MIKNLKDKYFSAKPAQIMKALNNNEQLKQAINRYCALNEKSTYTKQSMLSEMTIQALL